MAEAWLKLVPLKPVFMVEYYQFITYCSNSQETVINYNSQEIQLWFYLNWLDNAGVLASVRKRISKGMKKEI